MYFSPTSKFWLPAGASNRQLHPTREASIPEACPSGRVICPCSYRPRINRRPILDAITGRTAAKGDVLGVARVAGIMAAKRTWEVIPLCHPLLLSHLAVEFEILEEACAVRAECTVKLSGKTGVEMEALTGVSVALLTIYDMCKAIDKGMELGEIRLVHKEGGKSGVYDRG